MRMTNKIMQNNSLYNINNNKILQDKLSTQMSTQKKLTRPSDDPVVAIRALRLRSSVSELTQYKDKNAKDADAWLTVTADALGTASEVIKDIIKQMGKAANKDIGAADLTIIMEQVKSLRDEVYATANADYAGRYIFTGYRTDTPLSFTSEVESKNLSYSITEQVKIAAFDSINYTDMGEVEGLCKANYNDLAKQGIVENDIDSRDIHRLRLSYDDVSADSMSGMPGVPNMTMKYNYTDATGALGPAGGVWEVDMRTGTVVPVPQTVPPTAAVPGPSPIAPVSFTTIGLLDSPNPYQQALADNVAGVSSAIYIPETGEILFSDVAYAALTAVTDARTEFRVTYDKKEWLEGDLRPEHYFACTSTEIKPDGTTKTINYNQDYLTDNPDRQKIEYDVGYNQRIAINTTAGEVFVHTMDRNVDDLERAVRELAAIETTVREMQELKNAFPQDDQIQRQLDAANKAYDYIRENVHKMFEHSITVMQKALDDLNVAVTDNGTRSARLDLISNRLLSQKTTFETLQSDNEDIDIAETVIKLTSTELSYNAALMATGKIMQTSLMNYI